MVKIHVKGREIEVTDELVEETDPSYHGMGNFYTEGEWKMLPDEYEEALTLVRVALEKLRGLETLVGIPQIRDKESYLAQIKNYKDFTATYAFRAEAWGEGEDHADQRLDDAETIHDLGGVVRKTAQELLTTYEKVAK